MPAHSINLLPATNLKKGSRFSFNGSKFKTINDIVARTGRDGGLYYHVQCGFVVNNIAPGTMVYIKTKGNGKVL